MGECYRESKSTSSGFGLNRHVCTPLAKLPIVCQPRTASSFQKLDKYFVAFVFIRIPFIN